ncbi:MAG: hypothetical protein DRN25_07350 [Thermoplasmata archaeon]|nr:MAG: hypothetical protein DRN25_07350 [Thermoplasmata archaeon]
MESLQPFNKEEFLKFLSKPYFILRKEHDRWYILVPKFINESYGFLIDETETYRVYLVTKYTSWVMKLPEELKKELNLENPKHIAYIEEDELKVYPSEYLPILLEKLKKFVYIKDGKIKIRKDRMWDAIVTLVREGILPYKPKPVDEKDLLERYPKFELRPYQRRAWEAFLKFGRIGVFYPPGAGKTYVSLYIMSRIAGPKLITVPSRTLIEHWKSKIEELTYMEEGEYIICTYHKALKKYMQKSFTLAIYDECHHIPADMFSALFTLKAKYSIMLSGSPMREDGRHAYLFALAGFPVGLGAWEWEQLLKEGVIKKPRVVVFVVPSLERKIELAIYLFNRAEGKTFIFCDSIDLGMALSKVLNVPFVYGKTKDRLEILETYDKVIVSRVGDEGIDITNLDTIIEVDFLKGSRRQSMQRNGRLLHSRFSGTHYIIMTCEEFERYRKRLLPLYERNIPVKIYQL